MRRAREAVDSQNGILDMPFFPRKVLLACRRVHSEGFKVQEASQHSTSADGPLRSLNTSMSPSLQFAQIRRCMEPSRTRLPCVRVVRKGLRIQFHCRIGIRGISNTDSSRPLCPIAQTLCINPDWLSKSSPWKLSHVSVSQVTCDFSVQYIIWSSARRN